MGWMKCHCSQGINVFPPDTLPLWGPGVCPIPWPFPLREPSFHLAPRGPESLLTRGAPATWLESIPEASHGPRRKAQLLVLFSPGRLGRPVVRTRDLGVLSLKLETLQPVSSFHPSTVAAPVFQVQISEMDL